MTEEQVKKKIGKHNWKKFIKFMAHQTVGMDENGDIDYYDCDVYNFMYKLKTRRTYFWD